MNIIAAPRRGAKPGWTPAERPRGVQPARLGGRPGTSRTVLDGLFGVKPRTEAEFAAALATWRAEIAATQAVAEERFAYVTIAATTELDDIANELTHAEHMLFVPLDEEIRDAGRDIERDLVDAIAEWIVAEAATDAALFGTEETGAEAAR